MARGRISTRIEQKKAGQDVNSGPEIRLFIESATDRRDPGRRRWDR
jgi:hypothetical protein